MVEEDGSDVVEIWTRETGGQLSSRSRERAQAIKEGRLTSVEGEETLSGLVVPDLEGMRREQGSSSGRATVREEGRADLDPVVISSRREDGAA